MDIKELFEQERENRTHVMKEGHEARFLDRLEENLPKKQRTPFFWSRIAAAIVVLFGMALYFFDTHQERQHRPPEVAEKERSLPAHEGITLGDLSPDLEKVENYYVAHINYELSQLTLTKGNKEVMDGFMEQLSELDREYGVLNKELNELGPNEDTIAALIQNLQLRLHMLQKLKEKLHQLKSVENERKAPVI